MVLTNDKTKNGRDRRNETLFIDARKLGTMETRALKILTNKDIQNIKHTVSSWRKGEKYEDVVGYCKNSTIDDIKKNDFVLTPGRYVGFVDEEDDEVSSMKKIQILRDEYLRLTKEGDILNEEIINDLDSYAKSNWKEFKLKNLIEIKHGFAFPGKNITDQETDKILVTPGHFSIKGGFKNSHKKFFNKDFPEEYLLKKGDLIVTMTDLSKEGDTLGLSAIVPDLKKKQLLHNQRIGKIKIINPIIKKYFLNYLLRTKKYRHWILSTSTGSTVRHTSPTKIGEYKFFLPSEKYQELISEILKRLDDKIELNQKINQTLEGIAKILFKSWFIDFDPVRAKIDGRPKKLSKEINDLFPNSFEDSSLGEIPKGWKITKLRDIINIYGGQAFKSKDYISNGVFVLRTKNFDEGVAKKENNDVFLSKTFLEIYKDFVCQAFDYHLVMVGASIGKTGMILPHLLPALRNQNMWCFRPKDKEVVSRFYTKFVVDTVSKKLINFASGSARDFFRRNDFRDHQLIVPPKGILKSYLKITNSMLEQISINFEKNLILSNLIETLLPKLIAGKLSIIDAEKLLDEVGA